ncbi:tetratricopeptide repeat protein [Mucilaginibacter gracilis]|uniref:Tetratricopeptide repeat protein n=1 Tax=Mucilaginibacter gracilis TaxID=423350 RepID=A0A495JBB2_9SPHI|nr:tetratricopeptide repeat protein [Mucilaginibacter gracilis]RKR85642.1 tetratricopeptide repeat protein [Mucilaginibacter gracilis]
MKNLRKTYLITALLFIVTLATAQTNDNAKSLVKEGIALNDAGKYVEAIDKYKLAIKLDPAYPNSYYETGYSLFSSGKGKEAISYIEKYLQLEPKAGGGYDLLGSIYDDDKQPDKAIEYYKKGIEADAEYQRLHYNLAIAYYRQGKFTEAEDCAIRAVKLDPKHASSMRIYAMTTYKEQKRDCSLLGWCSFVILEPQTARSAEAYRYIKNILGHGITKTGEKSVTISVSEKELGSGDMMMQIAVLAATTDKKGLSPTDSLSLQLKSVFEVLAETAANKPVPFYTSYLAKYFGNLAHSNNMPAFARLISLAANADDSKAWFKEHQIELTNLDKWVQTTERSF